MNVGAGGLRLSCLLLVAFSPLAPGCDSDDEEAVATTNGSPSGKADSAEEFGETVLASVSSDGVPATHSSWQPNISADGRFVVFTSDATNFVLGATTADQRIYLRDLLEGTTTLVSVNSDGDMADSWSDAPSVSADGRFVVFQSEATNLVDGTNGQVFLRDMVEGTTTLVSVSSTGEPASVNSRQPRISSNGRRVVFVSNATNLVSGIAPGPERIYVHDLAEKTTELVSVSSSGEHANLSSREPSISADGRYVAFVSEATNLDDRITRSRWCIYVRDLDAGTTVLASVSDNGELANNASAQPSISADGRHVAFRSSATNLVVGTIGQWERIYVRDLVDHTTWVASGPTGAEQPNGNSRAPSIAADGRKVAFVSEATNLIEGTTTKQERIYVSDVQEGKISLVSVGRDGDDADGASQEPHISSNGWFVTFGSTAMNLTETTTTATSSVYVRTLSE